MLDHLTPEQAGAWRSALDPLDNDRVRTALLRHYQTGDGWPTLAKIVAASRPDRKPTGTYRPANYEFSARDKAAYKAGLAGMKRVLTRKAHA